GRTPCTAGDALGAGRLAGRHRQLVTTGAHTGVSRWARRRVRASGARERLRSPGRETYSQNIRTPLPAESYASIIAHTSACLPPSDHGYSPAIWIAKVTGERGWTGDTCWRISRGPSIRNCCCATSTWGPRIASSVTKSKGASG